MNYSTSFPATENPISESNNWVNGSSVGLDWANCRTTPGLAFGTQSGSNTYDDSTALLAGTWGPDQTCQAIIHSVNQQSNTIFEEVEFRLRSALSSHSSTGYEVLFSCRGSLEASRYIQIVRWNGAFGDFLLLNGTTGPGINDGDTLKATIVGSTITAYVNNVSVLTIDDSTYTTGNPGIGFYLQGGTSALNSDFGFSSFSATDGISSLKTLKRLGRKLKFKGWTS